MSWDISVITRAEGFLPIVFVCGVILMIVGYLPKISGFSELFNIGVILVLLSVFFWFVIYVAERSE